MFENDRSHVNGNIQKETATENVIYCEITRFGLLINQFKGLTANIY